MTPLKLTVTAFLISAPLAFTPAAVADTENSRETYEYLELFGDVFDRVRRDYVEEVSDKDLIEAAIGGMLNSLDPHSGYLSADRFEDMQEQTRGEFGGLGIEVNMEGGFVKVISPIDDTPAFDAGIQPGDFITAIDGESVLGLSLSEAVEQMRGLVGTDITVTIRREGSEPFDVTITRAIIKIRSVRWRTEGDIGYLRITGFNEQTQPSLEQGIKELKSELGDDLKGYVLDLRNNPGGLLEQAVSVTDSFLNQGEIVSTRSRDAEETQRYNARRGDLADGKPVVVLINSGSASASEIVAGALKDHGRAILLGTKTFGKGSVQTIVPLQKDAAMRLTTSRYYTPSGRSIQALGIEPDIEVQQSRIERLTVRTRRTEADLRGALDTSEEEEGEDHSVVDEDVGQQSQSRVTQDIEDYQLARALDLLTGIARYAGVDQVN